MNNRDILFRGKRVDNGEWVEGYYGILGKETDIERHVIMQSSLSASTIEYFYFTDIDVIHETVGQYTGLKDKNGNRIFQYDIVTDSIGNDGVVIWNQDDCSFSVDWYDCDLLESLYSTHQNSLEITGNIHENK